MKFFKILINNLLYFRKAKKNKKSNLSDTSLYSYIFKNDSIWLFYKKYDFTEKNINLKISF